MLPNLHYTSMLNDMNVQSHGAYHYPVHSPMHQAVAEHTNYGLQHLASCASDKDLIIQAEGLRLCTYKDTVGVPTICYGFNLKVSEARAAVQSVGGNYDAVMAGGCLSQTQCSQLLEKDLPKARADQRAIYGTLSCPCANNVTVDMVYNLGKAGLSGFTKTNSLLKSGQYKAASIEMQNSLWCRQVKTRCTRNVNIIASCQQ